MGNKYFVIFVVNPNFRLLYENECINVTLAFQAYPWSSQSNVSWWRLNDDGKAMLTIGQSGDKLGSFHTFTRRIALHGFETLLGKTFIAQLQNNIFGYLVACDLMDDVKLEVNISNSAGWTSAVVDIVMITYPTGISALMRDMSWLQNNICPVVGVAGGVAFLVIIIAQAAIIIRHRRHGCQTFNNDKVSLKM